MKLTWHPEFEWFWFLFLEFRPTKDTLQNYHYWNKVFLSPKSIQEINKSQKRAKNITNLQYNTRCVTLKRKTSWGAHLHVISSELNLQRYVAVAILQTVGNHCTIFDWRPKNLTANYWFKGDRNISRSIVSVASFGKSCQSHLKHTT